MLKSILGRFGGVEVGQGVRADAAESISYLPNRLSMVKDYKVIYIFPPAPVFCFLSYGSTTVIGFIVRNTPIETFPDVTNTQVIIITQWPGRSAEKK
jgi:hypothetical protein